MVDFNKLLLGYLDQNNISNLRDLLNILDYSYDGIALSNNQGVVFYVNQALERITGVNRSYLIGKTPRDYKTDGLVLKAVKMKMNENVTNVIQLAKTGNVFLITTVPVFYKSERFFFSNYREINELNNIQATLLKEMETKRGFCLSAQSNGVVDIFSHNEIIIESPSMKKLMSVVAKIANTDVTINITGESGVGKDVIAKVIHVMSDRKDKPFIQINCGSIPENLFESELFGYVEGSFTGAVRNGRPGLLELANDGTVYLDEIGDMPPNLQVKLLKVLQDQEILRIGGRKPVKLNLRIICATNQLLDKMITDGRFREDLYFRINMMPIYVPPLRERKDEIIHLTNFFLQKYNQKYGSKKAFSFDACTRMEAYSWPGNIRELKSLVERLVLITEEDRINSDDLPEKMLNETNHKGRNYPGSSLKDTLKVLEKDIILQAINEYGARKAADKLGIDYSTLKRKKKNF